MALDEREQGRTASRAELRARLPRASRFFFEGALSNPRLALMDLQAVSLAPAVSPQVRRLSEARLAEELSVAPVGRRVAIARGASRGTLRLMLGDSHGLVVAALLSNPRLLEAEVVTMAQSMDLDVAALDSIATHHKWCDRWRVKQAVLRNTRTSVRVALGVVRRMEIQDLERLNHETGFPAIVRIAVARRLSSPASSGAA